MFHSLRRKLVAGGVLLLLFLLTLSFWSQKSPLKSLTMPELLAMYQAELQSPGLTVSEAANNLDDTQSAYQFVRDDITLGNYKGHIQSPEDVLRSRRANGTDKAALLKALLEEMGWAAEIRYTDDFFTPTSPIKKRKKKPGRILQEINRRLGISGKQYQSEWEQEQAKAQNYLAREQTKSQNGYQFLQEKINYNYDYSNTTDSISYGPRLFLYASKEGKEQIRFDLLTSGQEEPEYTYSFELPVLQKPGIELRLKHNNGLEQTLLRSERSLAGHQFSIKFLPTIDTRTTLLGPPAPDRIESWTPVLIYDGELFSGTPFTTKGQTSSLKDMPPINAIEALEIANPANIKTMELVRTNVENWPMVRLSLNMEQKGEGIWLPSHFTILDNGVPVASHLLNITQNRNKILVLTDISYSMDDINAFETSKEAIINLIEQLPPETQAGLSSFAGSVTRLVDIAPIGDGTAFREALAALQMTYYTGIFNALSDAAAMEGLDDGIIILLTDGYDNVGGSESRVIEALKARNIRIFAIALGDGADVGLMQRLAEGTNGDFQKIRTVDEMEPFYARLGNELTSYVVLEYDAGAIAPQQVDGALFAETIDSEATVIEPDLIPESTIEETVDGPQPAPEPVIMSSYDHLINVDLKKTNLTTHGSYTQPETGNTSPAQLFLHVGYSVNGNYSETNRLLVSFDDPELSWKLSGDYTLMEDIGSYPARTLEAAYIANWQKAWGTTQGEQGEKTNPDPVMQNIDLGQMLLINGFRALSQYQAERSTYLDSGPNIYLRRSWLTPENGGMRQQIFDVLYRHYRGEGGARSWDLAAMELASARAEGLIIEGQNGIDALMAEDNIEIIDLNGGRPGWLPEPLWQEAIRKKGDYDKLIASPDNTHWVWQVGEDIYHNFRVLYHDDGLTAKGASAEQIASEFDKIDKMLNLYDTAVGNFAGLIPTTGAQLSVIASFKRTELKLWCFSTVMMGYVGESIEDEEAALNTDPEAAKANAARLCKLNSSPDDGEKFIRNAVKQAAEDGVNSFITNVVKESGGKTATNAHNAWSTGGALFNAATSFNSAAAIDSVSGAGPAVPSGSSPMSMTGRFHQAMAAALKESSP
jgi:von Willebrand factor type A domain-containing protein